MCGLTKVHAGDDARVCAGALGVQDLDADQGGLLGDAKSLAADGAGHVGAVAVGIGVDVVGTVEGKCGAALELLVLLHDARVDDEGGDALAGRVVKGVGGPAGLCRRQAGEAGGGVLLGDEGIEVHVGVGLDVRHLVGAVDLDGGGVVGLEAHGSHAADGEGVDRHAEHAVVYGGALADVALGDGVDPVGLVCGNGVIIKGVVVDDDVLVWDDILGIGVHDWHTKPLQLPGRGAEGKGSQEGAGGEKRGGNGSHVDVVTEVSVGGGDGNVNKENGFTKKRMPDQHLHTGRRKKKKKKKKKRMGREG